MIYEINPTPKDLAQRGARSLNAFVRIEYLPNGDVLHYDLNIESDQTVTLTMQDVISGANPPVEEKLCKQLGDAIRNAFDPTNNKR